MGIAARSGNSSRRTFATVVFVTLLATGACSPDDGESSGSETAVVQDQAAAEPSERVSLLEQLSEDDVCALVDKQSVAKAFNTTVSETEGISRGRVLPFLTLECKYNSDGFPRVATALHSVDPGENDKQALDEVFTDLLGGDGNVATYRTVAGLGSSAAFGRDATLSGGGINGWNLGAIGHVGNERVLVTISVTGGKATLAQVRPLAEEMLKNLEAVG